jgi:YfiH family protein
VSVSLLQSQLFAAIDGIAHGFSTREGGVSVGPFATLNLGLRIGDERTQVTANRDAVLQTLDRADAVWVSARQVHGTTVLEVTRNASRAIEADGIWTRDRGSALAVLVADCVPILLADSRGGAIAAVHAGWRGTRDRIVERMVERLSKAGFAAEDLKVAIGPAIGPCCFEVGEDVGVELSMAVPQVQPTRSNSGAPSADLWQLNREILRQAGVPDDAIDTFRVCTSCSREFFSHRRDGGNTGRQAGVITFAG